MGSDWYFQIYKSQGIWGSKWRWRLRAGNGEIVAQGQGYKNKRDCEEIVRKFRENDGYNITTAGIWYLD